MKNGLLMIERLVIESLSKKTKNLKELEMDTSLSHALLLNIIPNLLMNNLVTYNKGIYSIDKENCFKWLSEINKTEHLKEEAREIFNSLVNQYFVQEVQKKAELKIQKVFLTADESKVLRSHMINLESFFKGIKDARRSKPISEKTCEQTVVVWGLTNYSDLVTSFLHAV